MELAEREMRVLWVFSTALCLLTACGNDGAKSMSGINDAGIPSADTGMGGVDVGPPPARPNILTHQFPSQELAPFQETGPCVSWTLNNEKALYVNTVTLNNEGAFHHSNWFVVPDDMYQGPDGFFRCEDLEFDELTAAVSGVSSSRLAPL